ncbi:MAG: DNA polymerase III subunit alpha [Acidobacteriota bacterium]
MSFVHLQLHSHYSFLRSTVRLKEACARAAELGMPALALTDDANLFGAVEFCSAARAAGIKPILGCQLNVSHHGRYDEEPDESKGPASHRLTLLVENKTGYQNLSMLVSKGCLEGNFKIPRVDRDLLVTHHEGLIALSSGLFGRVGQLLAASKPEEAEAVAADYRDLFGAEHFFLELQDHGRAEQRGLNAFCRELGPRLGIGLVATNDPRFLDRDHFDSHRALTCIGTGKTLDDQPSPDYTPHHYFRTTEEMTALFPDLPEALENTVAIAERCNYEVEHREAMMPEFEVPEGETLDSDFRNRSWAGLEKRLDAVEKATGTIPVPREEYDARLELELDVICQMGYPGYFLITWDLMRFARENDIPVGPGRGSAVGSLVSYALEITDLDPLEHGLLFERFLNPERKSLPDIDLDFCQRRRAEMIRYSQEKYGYDRVAQIITFGTLNARSAIRDVGRVMNMTFGEVDRVAKLVPDELGITLEKAIETSPGLAELQREDERVARLLTTARQLEGLARNPGIHAAAVIIAPCPLTELVPLFKTNRDEITTQFAKDEAEDVGLLKMDFLGLKTLTVIHDALGSIERSTGEKIDQYELPMDDDKTFELFRQAKTSGVFQFESSGMKEIFRKLQPQSFVDLIALNALYRPGTLKAGVVDDFIERRHGRQEAVYPHEKLKGILEPTYGIMAFQEQVMMVAVELAGYSLGQADNLRKAMGKKKPEVMAAQRKLFLDGAKERDIPEKTAIEVFELMEYFAGYGFNKSHSAAYSLVAYWCGYLKAHYPAHFMAALLTSDRDNTEKVVRYINECRELEIEVKPPDVNESEENFTVVAPQEIRFGLSAIKGVGIAAVLSIIEARKRVGRFTDLYQFASEIDLRLNNRKVLEALIKAGALDSLGGKRAALIAGLESACDEAAAAQADRSVGQGSLFSDDDFGDDSSPRMLPEVPEWREDDRLRREKEVLGFYVSGHPLEKHRELLASITSAPLSDLGNHGGQVVSVVGIVTASRQTRTKKGDAMAFLTLEDFSGQVEVVVFPKTWDAGAAFVEPDAPLCVKGQVEEQSEPPKVLAEELLPLEDAEKDAAARLMVSLPGNLEERALDELLGRADDILVGHPGDCPVSFELEVSGVGKVTVAAADRFRVSPEGQLLSSLEELVGKGRVNLAYR